MISISEAAEMSRAESWPKKAYTASEARSHAKQYLEFRLDKELEPIFAKIKDAASSGRFSINIKDVSKEAQDILIKHGYTVNSYTISWD